MEHAKRISPTSWLRQIGLPIIVLIALLFFVSYTTSEFFLQALLLFFMTLATATHILFIARTRNLFYLVPLGFYLTAAITFFYLLQQHSTFPIVFPIMAGILFTPFMYILITRKLKWRYREILELAARPVDSTKEGFTTRPLTAGKISCTREELEAFAGFLLKQTIAFPYFKQDNITFVIPKNMMWNFLGVRKQAQEETFVSISNNGEVTAQISKKEYDKYQQPLTFNQLCESLAALFIDFFEAYKSGKQKEIIQQIQNLKFVV